MKVLADYWFSDMLRTRKGELLAQIKELRGNPGARNVEHEIAMLNDQVMRTGERIIKLRG